MLEDTAVTKMTKKGCMLSKWDARGHCGDKMTKKWYMLSPFDARGHRGDKSDQKVVHVVTMGWYRTPW